MCMRECVENTNYSHNHEMLKNGANVKENEKKKSEKQIAAHAQLYSVLLSDAQLKLVQNHFELYYK